MRHNANLNIRNVDLKVEARVVATTNDSTRIVILADIIILQAANAHSSSHAHLREDVDTDTRVHIELSSEVAAERCANILAARQELRSAILNEQLSLQDNTYDAPTVQAKVVAVEERPRETLVAQTDIANAHILHALSDKAEANVDIREAAIDKLITHAEADSTVIGIGIRKEGADGGATQAHIDAIKQ